MIAILRLEAIGDNHNARAAGLNETLRRIRLVPEEQRCALFVPGRRPWVARIRGRHYKFARDREFLRAKKDYSKANGVGSRGIYLEYVLREGEIYEVHELVSWHRERRWFSRAVAGRVVEVTMEEVELWLSEREANVNADSVSTS